MTKIQAHRGASAYAPENTLEAFRLGLEQGADGIELDVHLSRDGEIIVFHDLTLARMQARGNAPTIPPTARICDLTLTEIQTLRIQNKHTIPTLREVYELVASFDRPITINIELKTIPEQYPALPAKLAELYAAFPHVPVMYSSFNHYTLQAIRQANPAAYIGLLYEIPLVDPHIYARHLQANAIHPPYQILAALPQILADCRAVGIEVNTWTVNNPAHIQGMLQIGVDSIITDCPDVAVKLRVDKL